MHLQKYLHTKLFAFSTLNKRKGHITLYQHSTSTDFKDCKKKLLKDVIHQYDISFVVKDKKFFVFKILISAESKKKNLAVYKSRVKNNMILKFLLCYLLNEKIEI